MPAEDAMSSTVGSLVGCADATCFDAGWSAGGVEGPTGLPKGRSPGPAVAGMLQVRPAAARETGNAPPVPTAQTRFVSGIAVTARSSGALVALTQTEPFQYSEKPL